MCSFNSKFNKFYLPKILAIVPIFFSRKSGRADFDSSVTLWSSSGGKDDDVNISLDPETSRNLIFTNLRVKVFNPTLPALIFINVGNIFYKKYGIN